MTTAAPAADVLRFEAEKHEYFLNEKPIIGLTEALDSLGFYQFLDYVKKEVKDHAAARGTAAHRATHLYDIRRLDESKLHPEIVPFLESWKKFIALNRVQIIDIEKPIYSKVWRFGCTPDRIVSVNGKLGVLEIKASDYLSQTYRLQTFGQQVAAEEFYKRKFPQRFVVRLLGTGQMAKIEQFKDPLDRERFFSMLKTAQFKREEC